MQILKKIYHWLTLKDTLWHSCIALALLLILFLGNDLAPVFISLLYRFLSIIRPFVIGFMIAYILYPLVSALMNLGIKKGLAMVIVYVTCIILFLFLVGILLPAMISNLSELSSSLIDTARLVNRTLLIEYHIDASKFTETLVNSIQKIVENLSLVESTLGALSSALGYLTSGIIYVVISSYMLSGFERIKAKMKQIAGNIIHPYFPSYLSSLDFYMTAFLRGMVTLMLIRLVEYGFMYLMMGHTYWKELAILSAVSVFVPYLGPLFSCAVGVLTGFGLPAIQFVVMMILLMILFFVDSYIVLPDVYSKEINTHPIWILFAIITGINLFGLLGLLLAIPVFIAIRVAYLEIVFFNQESV